MKNFLLAMAAVALIVVSAEATTGHHGAAPKFKFRQPIMLPNVMVYGTAPSSHPQTPATSHAQPSTTHGKQAAQ